MNVEFVGLTTFVDAAFWNEINKKKLDEWRLDESEKPCHALVSIYDGQGAPSRISFTHDSLQPGHTEGLAYSGGVAVINTLDGFRKFVRKNTLTEKGLELWNAIKDGRWLENPGLLFTFTFTIFADLKKFQYHYWNCFPALCYPYNLQYAEEPTELDSVLAHRLIAFHRTHDAPVFLLKHDDTAVPVKHIVEYDNEEEIQIVVCDPSTELRNPGWPVRNVLAAVAVARPNFSRYRFISLRAGVPSLRYSIQGTSEGGKDVPPCVGWERTESGKLEARFVDLKSQFNPVSLMEQSVGLNLSLIKWRLVPELRLERFRESRVLMLGAGTLGCNLARGLMAWGVQHFTFVDNSTVSYSNPVRQSLSEFADAEAGRGKAECAAEALKRIYPTVHTEAVQITVPMPGHTVGAKGEAELRVTIEKLEQLVQSHDLLFLALDSREARWLPTVLAAKYGKMAFSVALGFDTFVIIRHGVVKDGGIPTVPTTAEETPSTTTGLKWNTMIPYSQLACYFCSDVTAPGNSTTDRTLDQQCTVSRAGLSMIASGLAVEVLASVLQHEDPFEAPALLGDTSSEESGGLLGLAPHQIRGFIFRYQQMTPCVRRFDRCVACGNAVHEAYKTRGWEFVRDVMNSPSTLELVTGLDQLQASVDDVDIDFNSDDGSSVLSMDV